MALFVVPQEYHGKSLNQIRRETPGHIPFNVGVIADVSGIDPNAPLQAGNTITFRTQPGSAEYQWLQQGFEETTEAEQAAERMLEAQRQQIEEETRFLEQYTEENPFVFDEELARRSVTAEYEPYYTELLEDYVQDIDRQRETVQDEAGLLSTLKRIDLSEQSRAYTNAVESAKEGFAGQGMFFSGIKSKNLGQREIARGEEQEETAARYGTQERALERRERGLDIKESRERRRLGREQQEQVESGILSREREAQTQYYTPLTQAYFRRFPTSSGSVLQGYTVPEYLRY